MLRQIDLIAPKSLIFVHLNIYTIDNRLFLVSNFIGKKLKLVNLYKSKKTELTFCIL